MSKLQRMALLETGRLEQHHLKRSLSVKLEGLANLAVVVDNPRIEHQVEATPWEK